MKSNLSFNLSRREREKKGKGEEVRGGERGRRGGEGEEERKEDKDEKRRMRGEGYNT